MSLHFPYAWAIVHGVKKEEYRSKPTNYRGIFLIHASGSKDSDFEMDEYDIPDEKIVRKAILGAVELVGCQNRGDYFAYILQSPVAFETPIPALGQQSIFWPPSTSERKNAFSQAWKVMQPNTIIDSKTQTVWFT